MTSKVSLALSQDIQIVLLLQCSMHVVLRFAIKIQDVLHLTYLPKMTGNFWPFQSKENFPQPNLYSF